MCEFYENLFLKAQTDSWETKCTERERTEDLQNVDPVIAIVGAWKLFFQDVIRHFWAK